MAPRPKKILVKHNQILVERDYVMGEPEGDAYSAVAHFLVNLGENWFPSPGEEGGWSKLITEENVNTLTFEQLSAIGVRQKESIG
jgi:hypothetical protein